MPLIISRKGLSQAIILSYEAETSQTRDHLNDKVLLSTAKSSNRYYRNETRGVDDGVIGKKFISNIHGVEQFLVDLSSLYN